MVRVTFFYSIILLSNLCAAAPFTGYLDSSGRYVITSINVDDAHFRVGQDNGRFDVYDVSAVIFTLRDSDTDWSITVPDQGRCGKGTELYSAAAANACFNSLMPLVLDSTPIPQGAPYFQVQPCTYSAGLSGCVTQQKWYYPEDFVTIPTQCSASISPDSLNWSVKGNENGPSQVATISVSCTGADASSVLISAGPQDSGEINLGSGVVTHWSWSGPVENNGPNRFIRSMEVRTVTSGAAPGSYSSALPVTVTYD
ncbi:hypothetical protein JW313_21700 [Enterobacter cloacae subsp. cloacae]|uniref:hypothetical protein n=1 Tax=Enterobacter cloacae TaxID=550 RepID=UPI001C5BB8C0|nr:hypothetical protein [Enterobacter cloacae]MBW4217887.1 hypothetical protein [Enterobacter cloacae subsp. cloacae]